MFMTFDSTLLFMLILGTRSVQAISTNTEAISPTLPWAAYLNLLDFIYKTDGGYNQQY